MTPNNTEPDAAPEPDGSTATVRRRRSYVVAGGVAVALIAGGGSLAVASTSTSADGHAAGVAAAASSSSSTGHPAGPVRPRSGKPARMVPSLDGAVTSASGATITIKDWQGFTRTIVTSGKTVYKNGLTADPAVGTKIHAEGTVDSNGTSLDATLIEKPLAGPGGPGGLGGPGGPRGAGGPRGVGGPGGAGGPRGAGAKPGGKPSTGQHPAGPKPSSSATSTHS